ncbi:stomatin-like protein 1 isoform X2 [Apteryx mantelli]|uniref:Stomatin-like protein 1 isoform X2 n=1 Tax=Apteryx mantelli TaxID=2696672 RepID=A0ABM4FAQ7_9AVES
MFSRSGYQALPLGDFDRFQQSSIGLYGSQKGFFSFGTKQDPLGQTSNAADSSQSWLSWICHGIITSLVFLLMVATFPISGWFALKIVPNYERMIIFRLGRIRAPQGPGMVLLLPFIDQWQRVDLRTRAFNVPPCKLTSKDGAIISMGADVQFRVWDPVLSVMMVKDLIATTRMTAQNAMTKTLLKKSLHEIQAEKLRIGEQLLLEINDMTKSWGLEIDRVELTMEAVLQLPQENLAGPFATLPPVPGLEGLDGTIQQLAARFFSNTLALTGSANSTPNADSVETVNELESPTAAIPTTSARRKPSADELLSAVELFLSEPLVGQVGASYQVNITLPSGVRSTYFIDLSSGSGRAGRGLPEGNPDVILEMSEKDLQDLFLGELRPLSAYMSGRLQVKGDLHIALKLEELFKAMKQRR